ncbi:hypothetical protein [Mesorhizobium sp.]|uniref:hypothetical protein n=1 Tax=Mesorhizobium sp. TaxID=1871066 RepID=UPI0025F8BD73|nr:hypothetical protein [Mesorhizobium sp.]
MPFGIACGSGLSPGNFAGSASNFTLVAAMLGSRLAGGRSTVMPQTGSRMTASATDGAAFGEQQPLWA